jgi:hypothetical protein
MTTDKLREGRGALRVDAVASPVNLVSDDAQSQEILDAKRATLHRADDAPDFENEENPPDFGLPDTWDSPWVDMLAFVGEGPDGRPVLDLVVAAPSMKGGL